MLERRRRARLVRRDCLAVLAKVSELNRELHERVGAQLRRLDKIATARRGELKHVEVDATRQLVEALARTCILALQRVRATKRQQANVRRVARIRFRAAKILHIRRPRRATQLASCQNFTTDCLYLQRTPMHQNAKKNYGHHFNILEFAVGARKS